MHARCRPASAPQACALTAASRPAGGLEASSPTAPWRLPRGCRRRPPAPQPVSATAQPRQANVASSLPPPAAGAPQQQLAVAPAPAKPAASSSTSSSSNGAASKGTSDDDVLIEFKNVHKSFGNKQILRGASFKIRRGEAVGIIGSSGTGKSTTLRIAAGLLQPDKGEVLIKGEPRRGLLSDHDTSDQLKVGLVFQSGALFDSLTVGQNVGFMLYEHSSLPPEEIEALVADSLAKVGLTGVERLYPSELSGGMKKRVALARAIVRDSAHDTAEQLIMYDEPTAGLDPVASTVVEDLIRCMHTGGRASCPVPGLDGSGTGAPAAPSSGLSGSESSSNGSAVAAPPPSNHAGITSYVVVTHQHSTIRRAVDRIIFLHEGRVAWEGPVGEFDSTQEPIVRQFASGSLDGPIVYV